MSVKNTPSTEGVSSYTQQTGKIHILIPSERMTSNAVWELKDADAPQKTEHQQDARQP